LSKTSKGGRLRARLAAARFRFPGRLAQLGERQLDKLEVTGSSPVAPIVCMAAAPAPARLAGR
jgi:hypothetical protein